MAASVRSIDPAASGYVRHRFVRALSASFVVAAVFGLLAGTLGGTITAMSKGDIAVIIVAPLGVLTVLVLFGAPVVIIVAFAGAVVDLLHRRIIGFALFATGLMGAFFMLAGVIYSGGVLLGYDMSTKGHPQTTTAPEAAMLAVFGIIAALICYEFMRAGWWQFTVSAENFRAARGWRPPLWRLLTSFRRYLGLPSFLSYVGRKRRVVTALYFAVAVLNLGLLMMLLLPVLSSSSPSDASSNFDPTAVLVSMGALLVLNLLGAGTLVARLADKRTTALYQNVREWDARAPIVFLRAFDQDNNKLKTHGGDVFARWPAGVGRARTLDEILLEHGSPYGPVIAIGDPRDPTPPLGAARVFVTGAGAGWQDVVRGLAAASKAVVICPNVGEGVQWELDLVAQAGGRLRTILLASPDLDRDANRALFARLVPAMPELKAKQVALAAYQCQGQWRVLTARRASVESYTAALNTALQALFGIKGEALKR